MISIKDNLKNIDIKMAITENIDINIDKDIFKNIDIEKRIWYIFNIDKTL